MRPEGATVEEMYDAIRGIVAAASGANLDDLASASRVGNRLLLFSRPGDQAFGVLRDLEDAAWRAVNRRRYASDHTDTDHALIEAVERAQRFLGST
jgi:hypothetical protein